MRLVEALGDLVDVPQFFVWRMTWVAAKRKYEKTPYYVDPEGKGRDNWMDYQAAVALLAALRATGGTYTLGWYLTADTGYWFFDIDGRTDDDVARWARANLQGAFCEVSSSGNGLHFVGHGPVPRHSMVNKAAALELYTEGRGIAFAMSDEAEGCADADCTQAIAAVAAHWFPYVEVVHVEGTDPLWRGPADDEELLRRALQSGSVGSILGNRASFADLWNRNVPVLAKVYPPDPGSVDPFGGSEADGALAMQLAFWTGRDVARVERLMRRSALARDKWDSERGDTTYLGFTVARACGGVSGVLQDKERAPEQPVVLRGAEGMKALSAELQELTLEQIDEAFIPRIKGDQSFSTIERSKIADILLTRLEGLGVKLTLASVKKMIKPSGTVADDVEEVEKLPFVAEHVYVLQGDMFFNMATGTGLSRTAFQASYNRLMPDKPKGNGKKEDAAEWSLDRWGMQTVNDAMYHPLKGPVFEHNGNRYVNMYSVASLPTVEPVTAQGAAAIAQYAKHLYLWCGGREDIYSGILSWMAFNVQNPGRKIRFAPILKGAPGDGKSIVADILKAAMGSRNVNTVGPAIVMNSGGFTDWAHGACVIGMEEMMMHGKNRHAMANAIKENITNGSVTINRKGRSQLPIINISNFICFTNHVDAIPLEDNDRRWWVMFSPFDSTDAVVQAHGFKDKIELNAMFDSFYKSFEREPGQWRAWLLGLQIPESFQPDGHAPMTPEKASMRRSGQDEDHAIARQVIAAGTYRGVREQALSSACLTNAMRSICIMEGIEIPKGPKVTMMIKDLGYTSVGLMKWEGGMHRMWAKPGVSKDTLRGFLDRQDTVYSGDTVD